MQTSRQRVFRALNFDHPDRVPRQLWTLPIAYLQHPRPDLDAFFAQFPPDITTAPSGNPKAFAALTSGDPCAPGEYVDEWGCTFVNLQRGVIGEVKKPLLADYNSLPRFRTPEELAAIDTASINAFCQATDRFVLANCCPRPFERMQFLRGSENLYLDLAEQPPEFKSTLARVHDFYCRELQAWAKTSVDALMFMDDWGSQRSLLIDPAQWVKLFKPLYRDYADIAHSAGKKLFMHSDGHIAAIYPHLVELHIDALNSQLFAMDIPALGRAFKGQITFWGEIDRQHILPHATEAETRAAVQLVAQHLGSPAGGLIAQFELGPGAKLSNAIAIFDEWNKVYSTN